MNLRWKTDSIPGQKKKRFVMLQGGVRDKTTLQSMKIEAARAFSNGRIEFPSAIEAS